MTPLLRNLKLYSGGLLAFIAFCMAFNRLYAQNPTKIWDKTIGANANETNTRTLALSDGSFILIGSTGIANFGQECYITKINSTGTVLWQNTFGSTSGTGFSTATDIFQDVVLAADGNLMVLGHLEVTSTDVTPNTTRGQQDLCIFKIDVSTGAKMSGIAERIGSNDQDFATSIVSSGDGNYILGSTSFSEANNEKDDANNGISDYWVLKIGGTTGTKIAWGTAPNDKSIGGSLGETLTKVLKTSDGGYLLAGHSASGISGDKTSANKGASTTNDYWIVKLDANGNVVWDKSFGTASDDITVGMVAVTGGYVVGGYTTSGINNDKTSASKGANDFWVVKFDDNGTKIWDKSYGTSGDDVATFIESVSGGGFVIGGTSASGINGDKTEANKGVADYWLLKLDADGNKVWDKTLGGSADDSPASLAENSANDFLISGQSNSPISGDKSEANSNYDFWVIKLQAPAIPPSFTATANNATCGTLTANADGKLQILTSTGITKFGYSTGSVYAGPAFASATAAGSAPYNLVATLPNPTATQPYTIRGFIDATTYIDKVVSLASLKCVVSDISVSISPTKTTVGKNEYASHTITVSNTGPNAADNVVVKVTLPNSVSYVSSAAQQGTYTPADKLWNVGTVAIGTPLTLTVSYKGN